MLKNVKTFKSILPTSSSSVNPTDGQLHDIIFGDGNQWVGFVFGSLFICLGIAILFIYPRTKRRSEEYKKKQMVIWKKNHPMSKTTDYNKTGLYLPMLERAKSIWPIMIGVLMIIVGIAWIVGNSLTIL